MCPLHAYREPDLGGIPARVTHPTTLVRDTGVGTARTAARPRRRPCPQRLRSSPRPGGGRGDVAARARGLTKAYGSGRDAVLALDSVDVDIARGRFTAVMGPSGSGQVHADALPGRARHRLRRARCGSATPRSPGLRDRELTRLRRDRIGFMFQSFNLIPTLNAAENITLPDGHRGPEARRRSG